MNILWACYNLETSYNILGTLLLELRSEHLDLYEGNMG